MKRADQAFRAEIDDRLPYDDLDRCKSIIERGIAISPYAAFAVLHDICRPGRRASVSANRLTQLLNHWRSHFDHPLAGIMSEVASSMNLEREMQIDEVVSRMNVVAQYTGLWPALEILYFSGDDVDGKTLSRRVVSIKGDASLFIQDSRRTISTIDTAVNWESGEALLQETIANHLDGQKALSVTRQVDVTILEFDLGTTVHLGRSIFSSDMASLLWSLRIWGSQSLGLLNNGKIASSGWKYGDLADPNPRV